VEVFRPITARDGYLLTNGSVTVDVILTQSSTFATFQAVFVSCDNFLSYWHHNCSFTTKIFSDGTGTFSVIFFFESAHKTTLQASKFTRIKRVLYHAVLLAICQLSKLMEEIWV